MSLRHAAAVMLVCAAASPASAHGGVGIPILQWDRPGPGEILEATGAPVELRWTDTDPDDDATLLVYSQSDPANALTATQLVSGISEDCDGINGMGPVYTGLRDAGVGTDEATRSLRFCGAPTNACVEVNDCYAWTPVNHVVGNYYIFASLDDDRGDGVAFNTVYALSAGIVRVSAPGINVVPALVFTQPDGVGDLVDTCFRLAWNANDPDDDARISVWLNRVDGTQEVMVAQDVSEDLHPDGIEVDISALPDPSEWVVRAQISDGNHPPWQATAPGHLFRYAASARDGGCIPLDAGLAIPDAAEAPADAAFPDAASTQVVDASAAPDSAPSPDASTYVATPAPPAPTQRGCHGNAAAGGAPWWGVWLAVWWAVCRQRFRD